MLFEKIELTSFHNMFLSDLLDKLKVINIELNVRILVGKTRLKRKEMKRNAIFG